MTDQLPFVDRRISVGRFDGLGLGIFANEGIERGVFVEIAPVIVFDTNAVASDQEAFKYVMAWNEGLAMPMGWTMIYNHSDDNNCEFSANMHDRLLAIMTVREVKKGEQLTVNYGPQWFSSRGIKKESI
jgi:uncharacterized protein